MTGIVLTPKERFEILMAKYENDPEYLKEGIQILTSELHIAEKRIAELEAENRKLLKRLGPTTPEYDPLQTNGGQ